MGEQGVRFHPRIKIRGFPAHSYNLADSVVLLRHSRMEVFLLRTLGNCIKDYLSPDEPGLLRYLGIRACCLVVH